MNPNLLRVTQRIVERSQQTREAYLARIEQAKPPPSTDLNWPAATWRMASPPVSQRTKPR